MNTSRNAGRVCRAVITEAVLIVLAGLAFGLAANAISRKGLELSRDYFPDSKLPTPQIPAAASTNSGVAGTANTSGNAAEEETLRRLAAHGLAACDGTEAWRLFQEPGYADGRIVFVDDRDDEAYLAGHIPGAYQFFHYRDREFVPAVLPICLQAEKVLVYCTGGSCEDSEQAAKMLHDLGVNSEKLVVYVGGYHDWEESARPIEIGARNSAQIRANKK